MGCPFCAIADGEAPANFVVALDHWPETMAFAPLDPVVKGHTLVVPKAHAPDFACRPDISAMTMRRAAELMQFSDTPMNLITSRGKEATQSVMHLHLHLVPRAENDGLALPWYSGKSSKSRNDFMFPQEDWD